ncbi:MAG: hypothetical protein Solumvirus2_41 [Solumvirus sp.]|uniref:Uncharacterized protein n=1 Tax=Solumvirus sp. TaxID=2487773 RepID=A0A3G5AI17_9VIRU|nr:MAG: hypothetical protein Solumvirus2_41 [Solumvirus sp.]
MDEKEYYEKINTSNDPELHPELDVEADQLKRITSTIIAPEIYERAILQLTRRFYARGWSIEFYEGSRSINKPVYALLDDLIEVKYYSFDNLVDQFTLSNNIEKITYPVPGIPCVPWIINRPPELYTAFDDDRDINMLSGRYISFLNGIKDKINGSQSSLSARNGVWIESLISNSGSSLESITLYKDGLMKINKIYDVIFEGYYRKERRRLKYVTEYDDYGYPNKMIIIVNPLWQIHYNKYYSEYKEQEIHYRDTKAGIVKVHHKFNKTVTDGPVFITSNNKIVEYYYAYHTYLELYYKQKRIIMGVQVLGSDIHFYDESSRIDMPTYKYQLSLFRSSVNVTGLLDVLIDLIYSYTEEFNYVSQLKEAIEYYKIINGVQSDVLLDLVKNLN